MQREDQGGIDGALAARVARMSGASQRWLKTALQSIDAHDEMMDAGVEVAGESRVATEPEHRQAAETERRQAAPAAEPERKAAPDLEDVLSGKATLAEQLEAYPELAEELEGLSDIVELLREAGERRRRRGEDILRREIFGEEPEGEGEDDDDDGPLFI